MVTENQKEEVSTPDLQAAQRRRVWLIVLVMIAAASIAIRILMRYEFHTSALLYIGIPFLISLAIAAYRPARSRQKWWHAYRDHSLLALIVFLGSSVVLFEGFVCVLFFMPIYFLAVSIGFVVAWIIHANRQRNSKTFATVLPLLVLVTAFEGTSDSLSFNRESHVTVTRVASMSAAEVMANLSEPFDLQKDRGWMISVFPMPYLIEAGSLNPGDVHRVYTRYHRWFATNTHEGELHLQIVDVQPNRITTKFIHDSTFFASYLTAKGTQITLHEITPMQTEITLQINYQRKLDPAWYFHPLQQFGVSQMAAFLIDEVMIREQ